MIAVHRAMKREGLAARLLLQVHDELLFELPPGEREVLRRLAAETMEGIYPLRVPLVVDLNEGDNWMEVK
jgi:DNA polymerase-1